MSQNIPDDNTVAAMLKEAAQTYSPPPGTKQAVKAALAQSTQIAHPIKHPNLWTRRTIMKRHWPKFAAVAAVIAVAILGSWWFQASPDMAISAYAQLAQAVDNSKAAEWVHLRTIHAGKEVEGEEIEAWYSMQPFSQFIRRANLISCIDGQTGRSYVYDVPSQILTISLIQESDSVVGTFRQKSLLDAVLLQVDYITKEQGVALTRSQERINGKMFVVLKLTGPEESEDMPKPMQVKIMIDPLANRIVQISRQGGNLPRPILMKVDYPATGPVDIYAFGVPRDAKIVDRTRSPDPEKAE